MIIPSKAILDWNKKSPKQKIVYNLSKTEYRPEGVGFDLRAEAFFKIKKGNSFIGKGEIRDTPIYEEIKLEDYEGRQVVKLDPNDFVIAKTSESISLPKEGIKLNIGGKVKRKILLAAVIFPRSTLFRSGLISVTTRADPGYWGSVLVPMLNVGKNSARIQKRARIANILFLESYDYITRPYEGPWMGGIISTHDFPRHVW